MSPQRAGLRPHRLEAPALLALGGLQSLAFAATWAWWLPLIAIAVLVWRLDRSPAPRRAAWLALCFSLGWLAAGTWWLFISMHRYGNLPAWMAAAAVLALSAGLSIYLAAAAWIYRRWRSGRAFDVALLAGAWLLAELARAAVFTGFPWVASGYSQLDGPLAALAPWVGVYGMGAVLAALAAAAVRALGAAGRGRSIGLALVASVPAALHLAGPGEHTRPGRELSVELLQPNVPQDIKFSAERMPLTLQWVASRLVASSADLVVAPETAIPLLPSDLEIVAPGLLQGLRERFAGGSQAALVGVPLGEMDRGYTNSVVGWSAAGSSYRYDKHHLVPFGEFIPRGFRWFTELMNIPLGDFARGAPAQPSFIVQGERAAPHICYEDLFGEELARRFADAAAAPTLLVNLSNIGWFGDTVAVDQHLAISRLRALEFQRPMIRATNTGATAAIDHRGRVLAGLPPFTEGVLQARVQGRDGLTPYARWLSMLGLWPLLAAGVLPLAAAALGRRAAA